MFIKQSAFKAITFKHIVVSLPLSYWFMVALRFLLNLIPQTGYLHPDEFFQNVEVLAGDILNIDISRTWEFNPKFPIRNIFVPKLLFGPPLHFIRLANPYTKAYLNVDLKTPYYLLVIPRLFLCLLSLINDYCLYRICIIYGQNFRNRLKILASSYIVLVYCSRCFSNTFEMMFLSVLLLLVAECMYVSDKIIYHNEFLEEKYKQASTPVEKVKVFKIQNLLPGHSFDKVFILSSLVVIGIFNRPTFAAFAFPPVFFWLHRGLGSKVVGFKDFNLRIFYLILCSVPTVLLLILVDSIYFGYLTVADIESQQVTWENWLVTPWNFLKYNMDTGNLNRHGLHSRWHHVMANVPLLFNVLGLLALFTLVSNTYRFIRGQYNKLPRIQSISGLMLFSMVIPVALLSLFPHQEARFIIPILIPLIYLYGNHLHANESDGPKSRKFKKFCLYTWYLTNIILTIFYGFIHQGGIYQFTNNLHYEIKSIYGVQTHVITTHSYSVPTYLLQLESTNRVWKDKATGHKYRLSPSTFLYKYGSLPLKALFMKIDDVLSEAEMVLYENNKKYRFYVAAPCALDPEIREVARQYHYFDLMEEVSYYPHFCSEVLPNFPNAHDQYCTGSDNSKNESLAVNLNMYERVSCFFKRFCLKVYRVKALSSSKIKM